MSEAPDGFVELPRGGRVAYQIRGADQGTLPIFLVRPLGGSMALWGSFRARLVERFRVVAFDHRGSGHSSPAPFGVTTRGLAEDALAVLRHLEIPRAHVFGISLGGMTATWLTLLEPSRVARLCLASTPARGLDLSGAGVRRGLSLAACLLRPIADVEAGLALRVLSDRFKAQEPEAVARIERPMHAEPARRTDLVKHAAAGARHDVRDRLREIHCPTLVLAGHDDVLLGIASQRALAAGIPGALFEVIPHAGHDLSLEAPLATADRIVRFFEEDHGPRPTPGA